MQQQNDSPLVLTRLTVAEDGPLKTAALPLDVHLSWVLIMIVKGCLEILLDYT